MNIMNFKNEKELAIETIKNELRENVSYEDGEYYLHYIIDEDKGTIEFFDDYSKAEETATVKFVFDEDFYKKLSDISGIPYMTEEECVEEYENEVFDCCGYLDMNKLHERMHHENENIYGETFSFFENHPAFNEDFTETAEKLYDFISGQLADF